VVDFTGSLVSFEVKLDAKELKRAMQLAQREGPKLVKEVLKERSILQQAATKRWLRKQADSTGLGGVRVPPDGTINSQMSRHVYIKIAKSIGWEELPDKSVRVGSMPFPGGVEGSHPSRKGPAKLAAIHQWGTNSFEYADELKEDKGLIVRSSTRFFAVGSSSKSKTLSRAVAPMKPAGMHPGFEPIDFLGHTQEGIERNFEKDWNEKIRERWGAR